MLSPAKEVIWGTLTVDESSTWGNISATGSAECASRLA
jgi:hypothetical protein